MRIVNIDKSQISTIASEIDKAIDTDTILFLSGGSTPKDLYAYWGQHGFSGQLPGAVGMVDERYGEKWHAKSNELMIKETRFLDYLEKNDVPFYPMLIGGSLKSSAQAYDAQLRELFSRFPRRVGILGIGTDGHTAGIPPKVADTSFTDDNRFVVSYDIKDIYAQGYGPRMTMTFASLNAMTHDFILAFGEEKRLPLSQMMEKGSLQEIPSRFFNLPEITDRVSVFTDQKV